jgi:hypothetical protein
MSKHKRFLSKSLVAKKNYEKIVLGLIIAVMLTVPISLGLAISSAQHSTQTAQANMFNAPREAATTQTQFRVNLAYAYVGPAPQSVTTYFEKATNETMTLVSLYPAVVRLNVTCIPSAQIKDCDAAVEVYGVKIVTDKGIAEYHAYFAGTNYNPSFSNDSRSTLIQYVSNLANISLYSDVVGNFKINWVGSNSVLSSSIGSITEYTSAQNSALGLFSAGKPNAISVTIYRIGYITMTNGSVSVFEDAVNSSLIDVVQLGNYGDGFLHNGLVPTALLPQENLFQPIARSKS